MRTRFRASMQGRVTCREGSSAVDGQAEGHQHDDTGSAHRASQLGHVVSGVPEGAQLDEGAGEEEAVGKADLNATQEGRNAGAVSGQVGQVVGHDGRRGNGGLQHADEGVAVKGLDDLSL